jgi:hypothetical protein
MGNTLKIASPAKLARLGHFLQLAKRAALPARCSMYIAYVFSLLVHMRKVRMMDLAAGIAEGRGGIEPIIR